MNSHLSKERTDLSHCHTTILLAEDDPDDQELLKEAFDETGANYTLHIVADGKSALNYLKAIADHHLPCLIILDYNMPELNGGDVLRKICSNPRFHSIPKVVLSTSDNTKNIQEALANGAQAYRVKPHNFRGLITIAKEMLDLCGKVA